VQYNNAGAFAGMSGTAWDDTNRSLVVSGATLTTSAPVIDLAQTWNSSGTTFTGVRFNAAGTSSANSAAASLLMDLQVGGTSQFTVSKGGSITAVGLSVFGSALTGAAELVGGAYVTNGVNTVGIGLGWQGPGVLGIISGGSIGFMQSAIDGRGFPDALISRKGIANLRFGAADAAVPVAQTLSVQSIVGGVSTDASAAAYPLTIQGAQGTGTGAGGSIVFQVAPAGGSGTAQNGLADALTITSNKRLTVAENIVGPLGNTGAVLGGLVLGFGAVSAGSIAGGQLQLFEAGGLRFRITDTQINMYASAEFSWSSTSSAGGAADVRLFRDAANTLAQRNGVNAQTFRAYNTYTDGSNYERGVFDWTTTANTLTIGTQNAGTGTARSIQLVTNGSERFTVNSAGLVTIAGTLTISGGIVRTNYFNSADDQISWFHGNDTTNGKMSFALSKTNPIFQFGGTTSSFPALKRSSTTLQARLADDSAFAPIQGQLTTDTAYTAGVVVPTGYITIYDSTGTAYRVPCLV
jgi:hypothetical protein